MSISGVICEKHLVRDNRAVNDEFIQDYLRCRECKALWHKAIYEQDPDEESRWLKD